MSRIRTNTLALGTSFFVTAALAFLQVKILTNYLSQASVGVWSAVLASGALLATLSELGLPQVLVRYGAKYDAEGRLARLSRLLTFALKVYFTAMVFVFGALLLVGPSIARLLGAEAVTRWLLILGYFAVASGTLRALNNASFRGLRRMAAIAALEISFSVMVTLGYFLLRNRLSVELALFVFLGASLLVAMVGLSLLSRMLGRVRKEADPEVLAAPVFPEVRGFWQGAAAAGVFLIAIEQLDKPLLATLVSFQALAVFHVAARLYLFARRLLYVPFQVMFPEITHKWEGPRRHELRADMELFLKLELGLGLMLVVLLAVFARPLLLLVSNARFLGGSRVLWVLAAVIPLLCLHQPLSMFLRAIGRVWFAFIADSTWLVLYLGIGTLLVGRWGLPGFVAGQLVASTVVLTYLLIAFSRLDLPRPPVRFFLTRLAVSAGVWAVSVGLGRIVPYQSWWRMGALAVVLAVVGNFLLVRGGFLTRAEEERAMVLLAGKGALGKVARFVVAWPWGGRMRAAGGNG